MLSKITVGGIYDPGTTNDFRRKTGNRVKAAELWNSGDEEGANRLIQSIPMSAYLARVAKETMGLDFLLNGGWSLAEAEAELGSEFFNN